MTEEIVIEILKEAFYLTFIIILPVLGVSLIVGVIISIFQAATSIQEMTLTFVPKILITAVTIIFLLPWMIDKMTAFCLKIFQSSQALLNDNTCKRFYYCFINLFQDIICFYCSPGLEIKRYQRSLKFSLPFL